MKCWLISPRGGLSRTLLVLLLGVFASLTPSIAAMSPPEIEQACNSLARMAFDLKDLVNTVATTRNPGPFQDILDEFGDISDSCLSNISVMIRSSVMTNQQDQQLIYEAYSNFVQGLFELMDAVAVSAPTLIVLDKQAEFRIPSAIHEVAGVVDALLFQLTAVFPTTASYSQQASNQKSQVDNHFRQAVHAFHLATANTGAPYSNTTTV
ncbi:hypothetical protein B0T22DRAFT_490838 [Podospora appendiculata]|uniref:Uncharacterized protein n=1 Tax=Podospora appendiculata TaxID=314037 RepID=A0AAE0XB34_9PEZI|nr:hypothetical protein B0T22DRAFT_490838 [Podospora appendiculata]